MQNKRPFKPLTIEKLTAFGMSPQEIKEYFKSFEPDTIIPEKENISKPVDNIEDIITEPEESISKPKKPRKPYVYKKPKSQRKRKYTFPVHWDLDLQRKFLSYKYRSLKKGNCFDLSYEQFETLLSQGNCVYCGSDSDLTIDRINSSIGYSVSNCQTCCHNCNVMKSFLPEKQFLKQVERVYQHLYVKGD